MLPPQPTICLLLSTAALLVRSEVTDFRFGDHAVDQCNYPIMNVTNDGGPSGVHNTLMQRGSDGVCRSERGYCIGDCVAVLITSTGGVESEEINVIVGGDMPPNSCSWDLVSAGSCGEGLTGYGIWHNCLVHDVCVWARCDDPTVLTDGIEAANDEFCGKSFTDGATDFLHAHGLPSCTFDADCPAGTNCILGLCKQQNLQEGRLCAIDSDCVGYCHYLQCYDGSVGDGCDDNSDCAAGLTCYGEVALATCQAPKAEGSACTADSDCVGYCHYLQCYDGSVGDGCDDNSDCAAGLTCYGEVAGATCEAPKAEGSFCTADSDCAGYCELLSCYDGSQGDSCGSDSDCQTGLTCYGVVGAAYCRNLKPEGSLCTSDADCLGYCQNLYCWDGSKNDQCGSSSDCQSGLSCSRCWYCAVKKCS